MTDFAFDAVWTHYERASLSRRYGAGTFVAVIDEAVIEWGPDEEEVRERAVILMGEPVYVGRVSSDPEPDFRANRAAADTEYEAYNAARDRRRNRRRFPMDRALETIEELRLIGERTEYYGGCFVDGGRGTAVFRSRLPATHRAWGAPERYDPRRRHRLLERPQ